MNCNNCHYLFALGTTHWCNAIHDYVYFLPYQSGNNYQQKNPIEEKLDKIIKLLEKKKK